MPRLPRYVIPGQPQHVIQRGNNRSVIFADDADYQFYLNKLRDISQRLQCAVHAYVLMSNHVHVLLTPYTADGIGKLMQSLGRYYVQYFNYTYERTGTLWEGRYRATVIDSEQYLLTCMRYIELNPVRAGMVAHPSEYPYSSYPHNAKGKAEPLVQPHALYQRLGGTAEERQAAYRALFKARIPEATLSEIRDATNKAWALGNDRFRQEIEKLAERQAAPKSKGGDRRSVQYRERHINLV
jgi:putative transposase